MNKGLLLGLRILSTRSLQKVRAGHSEMQFRKVEMMHSVSSYAQPYIQMMRMRLVSSITNVAGLPMLHKFFAETLIHIWKSQMQMVKLPEIKFLRLIENELLNRQVVSIAVLQDVYASILIADNVMSPPCSRKTLHFSSDESLSTDAGHLSLKPYMHEPPAKHHRHCEKSINLSKLWVMDSRITHSVGAAPSDELHLHGFVTYPLSTHRF